MKTFKQMGRAEMERELASLQAQATEHRAAYPIFVTSQIDPRMARLVAALDRDTRASWEIGDLPSSENGYACQHCGIVGGH